MQNRIQYLKNFFHGSFLPIHYYKNNQCLLQIPDTAHEWDLTEVFRLSLMNTGKELAYLISKEFLYYGIVRNQKTEEMIIIGPVTSTRPDQRAISRIMSECSIPLQYKEKVLNFFQLSPIFSYEQFIHLMALLYTGLTDKVIDPDIYFADQTYKALNSVNQSHSTQMYSSKEEENFHNTYHFEQELYQYVSDGNIAALEKMMGQVQALSVGKIGENALRQEKNIFIASITQMTRAAIAGGLDIETAYQLSDAYIQESEKAYSSDTISRLSSAALFDFTKRVASCKIPGGMSADIYNCIQYISTHTNQPISVEDVANAVGKSRSYLSRKFKQELGFNLSDFIMRKKLEEGKSLLAFTDKPISEISEYLCFSSQSYFQNIFKKKYKMTPYEYRKSALCNTNVRQNNGSSNI